MVRQRLISKEIILKPLEKEETQKDIERLAEKVRKVWPKGVTAVEAIREEIMLIIDPCALVYFAIDSKHEKAMEGNYREAR